MAGQHLTSYTSGDKQLAAITEHAKAILQLDQAFKRILPGNLGAACQVACVRDGEMVIYAHNGTVAARLRLLGNGLLPPLQRQGYPVRAVRIKVLPQVPQPVKQKSFQLSEAGVAAFSDSLDKIRQPEVRAAIETLLARRR